ncbi:restriction endonuclease [Moraxella haemolytica]|uniref:restriction endonuclease n=1 Tax=Moraxella haemolytica TaxID=2904119 RepID=UPI0025430222|nr:restriction endonuclease [Moraxella sp. ZY171148]WII94888.1 restriction endonuclease [Moraxella sp. ZY171148]
MTAKQAKSKKRTPNLRIVNINENTLYQHCPEILEILLKDRSTSFYNKRKCNIIWANNNYEYLSEHYQATCQITPNLITGDKKGLIVPRALKPKSEQKQRTKNKAEVFTPSWVVKLQNDALDANFINDDLTTYISRIWLEITCGEAPYIANRYEMSTAKKIAINKRVGFLDRKLQRINTEIHHKQKWQKFVKKAYQSCYGFEWNGDSLLLARQNLLATYYDYYCDKWGDKPPYDALKQIAKIISYNIFQMDGLTKCIPLSKRIETIISYQTDLFDDPKPKTIIHQGRPTKIKNWQTGKLIDFMESSQ